MGDGVQGVDNETLEQSVVEVVVSVKVNVPVGALAPALPVTLAVIVIEFPTTMLAGLAGDRLKVGFAFVTVWVNATADVLPVNAPVSEV